MPVKLISIAKLVTEVLTADCRYQIVDARPAKEFDAGQIAGAVHLDWESWCESPPDGCRPILHEPGYWGALADPVGYAFAERLSKLGLRHNEPIVVYADSARSKGREGRVAWMLLYLGALEVYLLDGGWNGWLLGNGPVAKGSSVVRSGGFKLKLDGRRRADLDQLERSQQSGTMPLMIDTRTPAEFHGDCYDYQPRKGRMPRSILFPFAELFSADGRFVDKERYLQLAPADLLADCTRVAYCEVGVRASTFALLHELYTGEVLPVYDGSVMEWGWHTHLPVIT